MVPEKMKGSIGGGGMAAVTEGAHRATGVTGARATGDGAGRLDHEVPEKAQRRRFTAQYKLGILEDAETCSGSGQIGALLRREGLYTSHLSTWRRQRREGSLAGLSAAKRGRKPKRSAVEKQLEQVERENQRLREELRKAHLIIDVQKKLLGFSATRKQRRSRS